MSPVPLPRAGKLVYHPDHALKLLAAILLQVGEIRITDETLYRMDRAQAMTQGVTYHRDEATRETVLRPYPPPEEEPADHDVRDALWNRLLERELKIAELQWELVEARHREAAMYEEWHALHSRFGGVDQEEI